MTQHIFKRYAGAIFLVALLFLLLGTAPALGAKYKVIPLSREGQFAIQALAINNSGVVTGYFTAVPEGGFMPVERGFIWDETGMKDMPLLHEGDNYCIGHDINDSGQVAGESGFDQWGAKTRRGGVWMNDAVTELGEITCIKALNKNGHVVGQAPGEMGVVWKDGAMTPIDNAWSEGRVSPNDINDTGYVAGNAVDSDGKVQAFVWNGTAMTGLGFFGGTASDATGINNAGHVVGSAKDETGVDCAFMWDGNEKTRLAALGGNSYAYAVNESDHVVGVSYISVGSSLSHAVVWDESGVKKLETLIPLKQQWEGYKLKMPADINDNGWITGYGMLGDDKIAFVLKPEISQSIGGTVSTDLPGYNMPLKGAIVSIGACEFTVETDENGRFIIENVPVGTYTLTLTAEGFRTKKITGLQLAEADDILLSHDDGLIFPPLPGDTGGNGRLDMGDAFNVLEDAAGM